jgi:alpha-maltose-1-phosphate synthase
MRILLLSNEYPPYVYGGAGVHVEYLARELARLDGGRHHVQVLCFGDQTPDGSNLDVTGIAAPTPLAARDPRHTKFLDTIQRDVVMASMQTAADVVHCHTWYSHFAGCLIKQLAQVPLVLTTHSLEPHRPWKVEQLGTAYHASSWIERTAYENADGVVAVSSSMKRDVNALYNVSDDRIQVIHNGIDLDQYRPTPNPELVRSLGIDPTRPYVLFVGRITRQKGIVHLVRAVRHLPPGTQVVLCAGAPDTPEIGREMTAAIDEAKASTPADIKWITTMVSREELIPIYTHAAVFVCPSVYEPFGIINLEAMACETPVVASAVGGIPEVVVHGETGLLVPIEPRSSVDVEPKDPDRFARDLAASITTLLADPDRRARMATAARGRVEQEFGWPSIARRTLEFYTLIAKSSRQTGP